MILFDLSATQPLSGTIHGGGEYARAVFDSLIERGCDERIVFVVDANRSLPREVEDIVRRRGLEVRTFDSQAELQSILSSGGARRFFSAIPYLYNRLDFSGMEVIFTVHGLRPIEMPTDLLEILYATSVSAAAKWAGKQLFTGAYRRMHRQRTRRLVSVNADRVTIVVPSEHTRRALVDAARPSEGVCVPVLYSPATNVARSAEKDEGALARFGLRRRGYFLLVSGSRWIKNSYRALAAIERLARRLDAIAAYDIVVTGGLPRRMQRRFAGVKVLPYVDRRELRALYAEAYCLIYPTLNEGFGYPPLEAMACGTPVISSNACSLPEIIGDAAMLFSPRDGAALAACMEKMVTDAEVWRDYSRRGIERHGQVAERQARDLDELCDLIMRP